MHIPDGYIGPITAATLYAASVPAWTIAGRSIRRAAESREVPLIALGGAFCFVAMLFNVPLPGGTTGHAVGAALAAIALGPGAAILAVSAALAIQALLFGDGGVLALGANCFNLGVLMPLSAYGTYQAVAGAAPGPRRRAGAAAVAGYVSVNIAALATALVLGLQPVLEPGHCPYGIAVAVPAMMVPHLAVVGFVEAAVTAGAVAALDRDGLLARAGAGESAGGPALPGAAAAASERARPSRAAWVAIGVLCLASPLGLIAAGTAWGEWDAAEIAARVGHVPPGMQAEPVLGEAPFPDYTVAGLGARVAYIISAFLGVAAVAAVLFLIGWSVARRRPEPAPAPPVARE